METRRRKWLRNSVIALGVVVLPVLIFEAGKRSSDAEPLPIATTTTTTTTTTVPPLETSTLPERFRGYNVGDEYTVPTETPTTSFADRQRERRIEQQLRDQESKLRQQQDDLEELQRCVATPTAMGCGNKL